MERTIYMDDGLEDFLKEKSDQYKLYPSDKVWSNIQKAAQPKKRWDFLILTVAFLGISSYLGEPDILKSFNAALYDLDGTTLEDNKDASKTEDKGVVHTGKLAVLPVTYHFPEATLVAFKKPEVQKVEISDRLVDEVAANRIVSSLVLDKNEIALADQDAEATLKNLNKLGLVKNIKNTTKLVAVKEAEEEEPKEIRKVLWGGENPRPSKLKWHISFSPTLSYRRLTSGLENIDEIFRGVPYDMEYQVNNVNNSVIHKPAIGAEVGAGFTYKLTKNLQVRAGVQLNYSRYQFRGMYTKPQKATLAVGAASDSLNVYSTIENVDGRSSSWLNNEYFQVAMPIGIEWTVLGNSNFKWNVAASAQPVYNFANNIHLLSTDFKHYAQDPSLIRKWNINAGVETFVSYKMGNFNWQAGPQFRYQLMSSYQKQYPIKEYMVDFGFKIGVTKTLF